MAQAAPLLGDILKPHRFDPSILREYDIRGIVDDTLTHEDALALGGAFGTFVHARGGTSVCVGYDGRHSSPEMTRMLIAGLQQVGMQVHEVGLGPTPMTYFALKDRMFDAAVMVTGSHNPSNYNGFKMALQSGPVYGALIDEIGAIAEKGAYNTQKASDATLDSLSIKDDYINRLVRDLDDRTPLTIAWDCGNGAAGAVIAELTDQLPGRHILIHDQVDGDFPAHHPDPTVDANLADLRDVVLREGCDFGVAFDGDGDRIGVVDGKGHIIRCDILLAIYASDVLETNPGAPIIGDIKCSAALFREIERLGGTPVLWKTGHSLIKAKMAELKAPLAGELSGHIFFNDRYYGFDDALYCAIRLMNAVAGAGEGGLASLSAHIPEMVNTPEIRIEVDEVRKFLIATEIYNHVMADEALSPFISDIDGIRYDRDGDWWLLRPSNTQNAFVIRFEAASEAAMHDLQQDLIALLSHFNLDQKLKEALSL